MRQRSWIPTLLLAMTTFWLSGCGVGGKSAPQGGIAVSVSPSTQTLQSGASRQFTATVSNAANSAVTWSLNGPGSISTDGMYLAPFVSSATPVSVVATSVQDPTKSGSASLTITIPGFQILDLNAPNVVLKDTSFEVVVYGAKFNSGAQVLWNGSAIPTTFGNDTRLVASIPSTVTAASIQAQLAVSNSAAPGDVSNVVPVDIKVFDPSTMQFLP